MLSVFGFVAALAFVLGITFAPQQAPAALAAATASQNLQPAVQSTDGLNLSGDFGQQVSRDGYSVTKKAPAPAAAAFRPPASGTPDPGTAQALGLQLVLARGWDQSQFACLDSLFTRESHWNVYAANPSGAYGIPQALPGSKMASAGADWATNPATQITWGLNYIQARYGTPCGAWAHSQASGSY